MTPFAHGTARQVTPSARGVARQAVPFAHGVAFGTEGYAGGVAAQARPFARSVAAQVTPSARTAARTAVPGAAGTGTTTVGGVRITVTEVPAALGASGLSDATPLRRSPRPRRSGSGARPLTRDPTPEPPGGPPFVALPAIIILIGSASGGGPAFARSDVKIRRVARLVRRSCERAVSVSVTVLTAPV